MKGRSRLGVGLGSMLLAALIVGCARHAPPAPVVAAAQSSAVAAPMPTAAAHPDEIIVQPGDTIYSIARHHKVPVRSIIEANGIGPPYQLGVGRRLTVPQAQEHNVQPGETLASVAQLHGVDASTLARTNGLSPPYAVRSGESLILPAPVQAPPPPRNLPPVIYAVSPGRSLAATTPPAAPPPSPGAPPPPAEPPSGPAQIAPVPVEVTPLPTPPPIQVPTPAPPARISPTPPPAPVAPPPAEMPHAPAEKLAALPPPSTAAPSVRTFLWPVKGRVIATYGSGEGGARNDGINIAAAAGTPVIAADAGTVAYAGNELRGYGNLVLIKHADGWMTAYAHNSALLVKRGEKVARGQAIARIGMTGAVGEPQLHFEIRHGTRALDPEEYLPQTAATAAKG